MMQKLEVTKLKVPIFLLGKTIVTRREIKKSIKRLAKEIFYSRAYVETKPILLCVMNGAVPFFKDLKTELRKLGFEFDEATIDIHSYDKGTSDGDPKISSYNGPDLKDRTFIIVEDIIDTAETIKRLCVFLDKGKVKARYICTLLFKETDQSKEWILGISNGFSGLPEIRHIGTCIENVFVFGKGLDYRNYGRGYESIILVTKWAKAWIDRQVEKIKQRKER